MDSRELTPAERYADLRSAGPADLDGFLRAAGPLSPGDAAGVLRVDLEARWAGGERVPVEHYLARLPGPDSEAAVDLIFTEYLLRERGGEPPDPVAFARRFPEHAAVLRDQIALHRALAAAASTLPAADPPPPEPETLPRTFGRYTLLRVLGSGGMGVVYLADDTQLGRRVALKVLRFDQADSARARRFHREARLAASLNHSRLCPVYDVGRVDGVDYLTMPYLPGGSLAARVSRGRLLPPAEAVRVVLAVAEAMAAAHAAGVIHRDLKPANVLLDDKGEPVVTDFGLARRAAGDDPRLTASGAMIGTPAYMPPEQVGASPDALGPAADVYSLGAVLFELLTGRPPFAGDSAGDVLRQVLTADPPRADRTRPGVDPGLSAVCGRAMAKNPADRYATMAAFAAALANPPARRRARPALWAAGVTAAAALVGLGVWAAWVSKYPVVPAAPSAPADDALPVGSRWVGEFRFGEAGPHSVSLTVSARDGERFRGDYQTEGVFRWGVDGTLRDGSIHWTLSRALNAKAAGTGATGKAFVSGRLAGAEMRATFHDPADGSRAELTLTRTP